MEPSKKIDIPPDVQANIYRLALSLDSLFVNGIQFGIFQPTFSNGLVERLSETLLKDLDIVQQDLPQAPAGERQKAQAALDEIRSGFLELTNLLVRLTSFRSFSLTDLHTAVSRSICYREEAARLIADLEGFFRIPKPFYASRPKEASAAVEHFMADLPRSFEMEWNAARSEHRAHSA